LKIKSKKSGKEKDKKSYHQKKPRKKIKPIQTGKKVLKKSGKKIKAGTIVLNRKRLELQKKIAKRIGIIIIATFLIVFTLVIVYYPMLEGQVAFLAQKYGPLGIFVTSLIADMFMQPIGPDIPLIGGIIGGINKYFSLLAATMGSIIASLIGYTLGYFYGEYGFKKIYGEKRFKKWEQTYSKWGPIGVSIAAISPVPYVPFCWISGIFRLQLWKFIIFAFIPRIARFYVIMLIASAAFGA